MKMQLKHALAYLAGLGGTLGMAWGAHADWFYDFQTPPPPSFITGGPTPAGPPSGTFSSTVDGGVLRFFDTNPPAEGGARIGIVVEPRVVFAEGRITVTLNPPERTDNQLPWTSS